MSGGHWGYSDQRLEAIGQQVRYTFRFLAAVEHELDWGICCDTCLDCAKRRVAEAMIRYFDGDVDAAIAIARDQGQNQCPRHSGEKA